VKKMMTGSLGRVRGFLILLVFAFMLIWSSVALCGEIHEAVKNNESAKVRKLIKNNSALVFSKDEDGFTPLHLAAANSLKEITEFLLTTKAEVNAKDNAGSTPLHQAAAAEIQHRDIVEVLLAHKADVNAAVDTNAWQLLPGDYTILVGGSSQSLPLKNSINLQ
jgi:ankyrin repeat protein